MICRNPSKKLFVILTITIARAISITTAILIYASIQIFIKIEYIWMDKLWVEQKIER